MRDRERCHQLSPRLDVGLKMCDFGMGGGDDKVHGIDVGGFGFPSDDVDVDVLGDFSVSLCNRLQKCRLEILGKQGTWMGAGCAFSEPFSPNEPYRWP
jgi:hypothetical protein